MSFAPPTARVRGLVRAVWITGLAAAALHAGQPVEPPRNQFAGDAWQLPPEAPVNLAAPLQTHCQLCHSSDYLATQPPLSKVQWTAIVEKMRGKFGAVIPTNQVPGLVETLSDSFSPKAGAAAPGR